MTDHYAVIGNPISHSKSPQIHTEFAKQTQQDLDYVAREIPLEDFSASLQQLQQDGYKGINITVPFKEQAWQLVRNKSSHAERAGAINTIVFNDDGSMYGDNTDGIGLCRDLINNHAVELENKRVLLLGAGGASRGVIEPLLKQHPAELFIANRTASKALDLATLFSDFGNINGGHFEDLTGQFDIIINATSASLQGDVPPLPEGILAANGCCYDMMYSDHDTAFTLWAKSNGASKAIDGLGMLVEQAAEAYKIWRHIQPDTHSVIALLRK